MLWKRGCVLGLQVCGLGLDLGLGHEGCGLGLDLGLEGCGLGLGLGGCGLVNINVYNLTHDIAGMLAATITFHFELVTCC